MEEERDPEFIKLVQRLDDLTQDYEEIEDDRPADTDALLNKWMGMCTLKPIDVNQQYYVISRHQLDSYKKNAESLHATIASVQTKIVKTHGEINQKQSIIDQQTHHISYLQTQINLLKHSMEELQNQTKSQNEIIKVLSSTRPNDHEKNQLAQQIEELRNENYKLSIQLQHLQSQDDTINLANTQQRSQQQTDSSEKAQKLTLKIENLAALVNSLKYDCDQKDTLISQYSKTIDLIKAQQGTLAQQLSFPTYVSNSFKNLQSIIDEDLGSISKHLNEDVLGMSSATSLSENGKSLNEKSKSLNENNKLFNEKSKSLNENGKSLNKNDKQTDLTPTEYLLVLRSENEILKARFSEAIQELDRTKSQQQKENAEQAQKIKELTNFHDVLSSSLRDINKALDVKLKQLESDVGEEYKHIQSIQEQEQRIEQLRQQIKELQDQQIHNEQQHQKEVERLQTELDLKNQLLDNLMEKNEESAKGPPELVSQLEELRQQVMQLTSECEAGKKSYELLNSNYKQLTLENQSLKELITQNEEHVQITQNKDGTLENQLLEYFKGQYQKYSKENIALKIQTQTLNNKVNELNVQIRSLISQQKTPQKHMLQREQSNKQPQQTQQQQYPHPQPSTAYMQRVIEENVNLKQVNRKLQTELDMLKDLAPSTPITGSEKIDEERLEDDAIDMSNQQNINSIMEIAEKVKYLLQFKGHQQDRAE